MIHEHLTVASAMQECEHARLESDQDDLYVDLWAYCVLGGDWDDDQSVDYRFQSAESEGWTRGQASW